MPGQTIEDITSAEAIFLEKVIALHPEADGKPCVIGNCQAGWAIMMLAALRPELFGPIIIAGSPLSYWAGVRGKYPMRYSGGLLGGSWLTALTSDLGGGKFDGAWLVQNFENQNPANTLWTKQYNLYSKIDTEAATLSRLRDAGGAATSTSTPRRYNSSSMSCSSATISPPGRIQTSDGTSIDLRNIRSPIVVFCSKGDNITPPQQALGWILDLYEDVDDIRSYGQTIVYTIHDTIGHLGIFVSGGVARKEHDEFSSNIDMIDVLPPGLYEAVIEAKTDGTEGSEFVTGEWVMRCEARTLDDIRTLGGNDVADDRRFATAVRVSEINLALYRTFPQPLLRQGIPAPVAELIRQWHPLRLQYSALADRNPVMGLVKVAADQVRQNRKPAPADNPFIAFQDAISQQIVGALDSWRDMTEAVAESTSSGSTGRLLCRRQWVSILPASSLTARRQKLGLSGAAAGPDRRTEVSDRHGRLARMPGARPHLCRDGTGRSRRTRAGGAEAAQGGGRRQAAADIVGVQNPHSRAAFHAADRSGSDPFGDPASSAARPGNPPRSLHRALPCPERQGRRHRRSRGPVETLGSAVRGRGRSRCDA